MSITLSFFSIFIEWYEYSVIAHFINILPTVLLGTEEQNLMLGFYLHGVGFVARPLGALYFGAVVETYGPRVCLLSVLFTAAIGSLLLAGRPKGSLFIFLTGRLFQGFAMGGSYGAQTQTLVYELRNDPNRHFKMAIAQTGFGLGLVAGDATYSLLFRYASKTFVNQYGWSLALGLSGLISLVVCAYCMPVSSLLHMTPLTCLGKTNAWPIITSCTQHTVCFISMMGSTSLGHGRFSYVV